MGHSFYFKRAIGFELCEINYAMLDYRARRMYRALDAENCDGGVSGDGTVRRYTREDMFWIFREFQEMSFYDMMYNYTTGFFSMDEIFSYMSENDLDPDSLRAHLFNGVLQREHRFLCEAWEEADKVGFVEITFC